MRKFDHPRRLSRTIDLRVRGERAPRLGVQRVLGAAHVEHAHGRQAAGDALGEASGAAAMITPGAGSSWNQRLRPASVTRGEPQALHAVDGLRARGRGAGQQPRAGLVGAEGGDVAGVVARVALLLVGGVVLLVDDDQPEALDRREDRRARADGDPRLAGAQAAPLVVALALADSAECSSATVSPKRAAKRATVCGVSAISGTSAITPSPRSSAAAAARR